MCRASQTLPTPKLQTEPHVAAALGIARLQIFWKHHLKDTTEAT